MDNELPDVRECMYGTYEIRFHSNSSDEEKREDDKGVEEERIEIDFNPEKWFCAPKDGTKIELDSEVFREPPENNKSIWRMDNLSSFAVLGLDVKITPENEVRIIEVNGLQSGMRGFGEAGVDYNGVKPQTIDELKNRYPKALWDDVIWEKVKANLENRNSCDEALRNHIKDLGREPVAYVSARLKYEEQPSLRIDGAENLMTEQFTLDCEGFNLVVSHSSSSLIDKVHKGWHDRYGEIADTLIGIEKILEDKLQTDRLFEDCREIKGRTYECTNLLVKDLLKNDSCRYVVVKPNDGKCGSGLGIYGRESLTGKVLANLDGMVVEEFVPSKQILSSKDGELHDGCMRYIIFAEQDKRGEIKLYHFGGYWRLAPKPISSELDIEAMRANISQGAIPEKASEEELELVRNSMEENIPIFYRSLVNAVRR